MAPFFMKNVFVCACLACLLAAAFGCNRQVGPPAALGVDQIPSEFERVFKSATPPAKELAQQVSTAVGTNGLLGAFSAVQDLCGTSGLSKEQNMLAIRAMLAIKARLQDQQNQGDESAGVALRSYQKSR
jgi:hypothetical protein